MYMYVLKPKPKQNLIGLQMSWKWIDPLARFILFFLPPHHYPRENHGDASAKSNNLGIYILLVGVIAVE